MYDILTGTEVNIFENKNHIHRKFRKTKEFQTRFKTRSEYYLRQQRIRKNHCYEFYKNDVLRHCRKII